MYQIARITAGPTVEPTLQGNWRRAGLNVDWSACRKFKIRYDKIRYLSVAYRCTFQSIGDERKRILFLTHRAHIVEVTFFAPRLIRFLSFIPTNCISFRSGIYGTLSPTAIVFGFLFFTSFLLSFSFIDFSVFDAVDLAMGTRHIWLCIACCTVVNESLWSEWSSDSGTWEFQPTTTVGRHHQLQAAELWSKLENNLTGNLSHVSVTQHLWCAISFCSIFCIFTVFLFVYCLLFISLLLPYVTVNKDYQKDNAMFSRDCLLKES